MKELNEYLKKYRYGKLSESLKKALTWLINNQEEYKSEIYDFFDYPGYWGMPKDICYKLSSDEVDFIQEITFDWIKYDIKFGKMIWVKK